MADTIATAIPAVNRKTTAGPKAATIAGLREWALTDCTHRAPLDGNDRPRGDEGRDCRNPYSRKTTRMSRRTASRLAMDPKRRIRTRVSLSIETSFHDRIFFVSTHRPGRDSSYPRRPSEQPTWT